MMRQLVSDGLLPAGAQLMPIPKTLKPVELISQFDAYDDEDEDGPGTQGTAYLLSSPHLTSMMRHWRVGSIAPLPGLDPEILDLYGDTEPARLEATSHDAAGRAYECRNDRAAMDVLCTTLRNGDTTPAATGTTITAPAPARGRRSALIEDRVLAALNAATEPMNADAILAAVNTDGGKTVQLGSIRNALSTLTREEKVTRPDGTVGLYTPAQ